MSLRKAREKQNKQDDTPEVEKQSSAMSKGVSKRELVRQGEYTQLAALVPKDLVKRLKYLVVDDDSMDISDHVAAALSRYLDDITDEQ
jgi:hypothetical protein